MTTKISLRISGDCSNHCSEVGLGLVFLGSIEAANALGVGELENPLNSLPATCPALRIVMSIPVLPRGRLGIDKGFTASSAASPNVSAAEPRLTAEAVATAEA